MALDGFIVPNRGYQNPDLDDDISRDPCKVADLMMVNAISEVVERHYPGHPWFIKVMHAQGVVLISIPLFMGATNQYVVKIHDLKSDPGMRCVIRACGEILERYNIPRQRFDRDHFLNALYGTPIRARGHHGFIPT